MSMAEKIKKFIELTASPEDYAKLYLENFDGDLETAVNAYLESQEVVQGDEEDYKTPEKVKISQLASNSGIESNTFVFRNFKDEAQGKITNYQQFVPLSESSVLGDFGAACERAEKENKWVLAHVFKESDLECLTFIRDVWKSTSVRWVLSRNFILWVPLTSITSNSASSNTGLSSIKTCNDYVTHYKVKIPNIALHNPITGELIENIKAPNEKELNAKLKDIIRTYDHPLRDEIPRKIDNICDISSSSSSSSDDDLVCFGAIQKPKQSIECEENQIIEINESLIEIEEQEQNKELDEQIKEQIKEEKKEEVKEQIKDSEKVIIIENEKEEIKTKTSVFEKAKEGKCGKIKITFDKQTKVIDTYENYTIGDILELIEIEFNKENKSVWANLPRRRIDLMDKTMLLKEAKLYPSSVLIVEKQK